MMLKLIASLLLATAAPLAAQPAAPAAPAPSAAKLALGTRIAGRLMPDGTYRRMMHGTMDQMMGGMIGKMGDVPLRDLAGMGGLSADQLKSLGSGSLNQMMAILDPAYQERMKRTMKVVMDTMTDFVASYEPTIRAGLAEAYAERLDETQLTDLDRFLATPSGTAYAHEAVAIMTDPAVMRSMQAMMPGMIKVMSTIGPKVEAATADLPKRRKPADLTPAERKRLADLMGVEPSKLDTPPPASTPAPK